MSGAAVFLLSIRSIQSLQLLECIGSEINSLAYIREVRSSIPELNINILISQPWLSSFFAMNGARLVTSSSRCYWCDSRNLSFFFKKNSGSCMNTRLTTIGVLKIL